MNVLQHPLAAGAAGAALAATLALIAAKCFNTPSSSATQDLLPGLATPFEALEPAFRAYTALAPTLRAALVDMSTTSRKCLRGEATSQDLATLHRAKRVLSRLLPQAMRGLQGKLSGAQLQQLQEDHESLKTAATNTAFNAEQDFSCRLAAI